MSETIYDKQYLGRGQMKIQATTPDFYFAKILILLTILAVLFNAFFLNPWWKTVSVESPEVGMSDRQQEQLMCSMWATQKEAVVGGTTSAIRKHCSTYLN